MYGSISDKILRSHATVLIRTAGNTREFPQCDVSHGDLFKTIIVWTRWRKGETHLQWTRGHSGTRGNEEADRLAGAGAERPMTLGEGEPADPPGRAKSGAVLASLEQRDFYRIIRERRKTPVRAHSDRNVAGIQEGTKEMFGIRPTPEKVWLSTRHKDLTRKTRDFL